MTPSVVLVQTPTIDFDTFLTVAQQALGRNVADAVDSSPVKRSEAERFLSCLAAMKDKRAKPGAAQSLLGHVSFSVMVAADSEEMLLILEAAGMEFVVVETVVRDVQLAVITGTLAEWRDAVRYADRSVRTTFNRIANLFAAVGMDVWKECKLLESK
jgi:hypothetical protein